MRKNVRRRCWQREKKGSRLFGDHHFPHRRTGRGPRSYLDPGFEEHDSALTSKTIPLEFSDQKTYKERLKASQAAKRSYPMRWLSVSGTLDGAAGESLRDGAEVHRAAAWEQSLAKRSRERLSDRSKIWKTADYRVCHGRRRAYGRRGAGQPDADGQDFRRA